ncbi:hypothetical protein ACWDTP_13720 [Mycobacterium sp. NPDC003449]
MRRPFGDKRVDSVVVGLEPRVVAYAGHALQFIESTDVDSWLDAIAKLYAT